MSEDNAPEFRAFENREIAALTLAAELGEILESAIEARRAAALVVSGGTTPAPMFRQLRERLLDWSRVTIVPSDERDVPLDHPDRNERMIREELLQGPASGATLCSLIPPGSLPAHFDATVLGMGEDGHTASLFPQSPDLSAALASTEPLEYLQAPQLEARRISLTPKALLASSQICLLIFGEEKRRVIEAALQPGPVSQYPVRVVLQQDSVPVTIFWAG
ncbi:MAG: 6-phosphogluconolactonase [Xanthomonadales bacterium]|jgi:6-phosphogluconolactonase|nr:6-phosphogluconolactonase [Xanthomonadales bacterium]